MGTVVKSLDELTKLIPIKYESKGFFGTKPGFKQDKRAHLFELNILLSYLYEYQKTHRGQSPTVGNLANEFNTQWTQMMKRLRKLEEKGEIDIMQTNPLRVIIMHPEKVMPLDSARRIAAAAKTGRPLDMSKEAKKERYDAAEARRRQLAYFIADTWKRKGRGPTMREMMDQFAPASPGYINRMIEIYEERGLLTHVEGSIGSVKLTENGEMVLGVKHDAPPAKEAPEVETVTAVEAATEVETVTAVEEVPSNSKEAGHRKKAYNWRTPEQYEEALDKMLAEVRRLNEQGLPALGKDLTRVTGFKSGSINYALFKLKDRGVPLVWGDGLGVRLKGYTLNQEAIDERISKSRVKAAATRKLGRAEPAPPKVIVVPKSEGGGLVQRKAPHIRAKEIMPFIVSYIDENGVAPQVNEIRSYMTKMGEGGDVARALNKAEEMGFITRDKNKLRSIKITEKGRAMFGAKKEEDTMQDEHGPSSSPDVEETGPVVSRRAVYEQSHNQSAKELEWAKERARARAVAEAMNREEGYHYRSATNAPYGRGHAPVFSDEVGPGYMRTEEPYFPPEPARINLSHVSDRDLAWELMQRGWFVTRR